MLYSQVKVSFKFIDKSKNSMTFVEKYHGM